MVAVCPPMTSGLVPGLLARRLGIPLVIHVQDLQLDAARELGITRDTIRYRMRKHGLNAG